MKGENIIDSETRVINCIYAALAKNDGKERGVIKQDQTPFSIPHIAVLLVLHTLITGIQTRRYTM